MAQAPYEIIAGPAQVWVADVGTAFPATNAAPGGSWTDLGYTDGGITVTHNQDIEQLYVDQISTPVKVLRTTESLTVEFSLAQLTLERWAKVINNNTVTTVAGPPATKEMQLQRGADVARHAMLVRGPSPYFNGYMQFQVLVVIHMGEPSVTFNRDQKAVLSTSWSALADTTQAAGQQFGKLVAQTS